MAQFNRGINRGVSTILLLGAIILLILSATFFAQQDVSSAIYLRSRDVLSVANPVSSGFNKNAPAAHLEIKSARSLGREAGLRHHAHRRSNTTRRVLPTLTYEDAKKRGIVYYDTIEARTMRETPFKSLDDLTGIDKPNAPLTYGWSRNEGVPGGHEGIYQDAFKALNIPRNPFLNRYFLLDQELPYVTCGQRRDPTNARCHGTYNTAGKTIVALDNVSPNFQLREKYNVDRLDSAQAVELPKVAAWSDLVWILWTSLPMGPDEPSTLKYIFRHHITTRDTLAVIEHIFDLEEGEVSEEEGDLWPGLKTKPGEDNFYALLGTPHGRGVAYLVSQHPDEAELGGKSIESINVFVQEGQVFDQDPDEWHLLFTLTGEENEPLPDSDDDEPMGSPPKK